MIEELIINCSFNRVKCNLERGFVKKFSWLNGKCNFYNMLDDKISYSHLSSEGLFLELFSGFIDNQPAYSTSKILIRLIL